ncbi:CoA ester lyase [Pseudonocardia sp. DR1-2]|uniref:HpcH/HpaI aldolase/citrate lyase family protein n=1 Tax=Pseudonocardia sp. DR1-2 TaxID=2951168 RepID=UPI0020440CAA|nr:CoA ester lyase [Pseudonocardia sp. DR1-2]MCM3849094.1 CoA ester lyase [Pseudonocardia sp. DR1-2]
MSAPLTWLYVPGDRPERFAKAAASGADVVVVDLEDAVAPPDKARARAMVVEYLTGVPDGPPVHVRINDDGTGRDDVAALAGLSGLGGLRVPKVESTDALDALDAVLPAHVRFWPLVETARGCATIESIAAHPRVAGIALGEQDLAAALHLGSDTALDHLRVRAVLAAAAAGLPAPPMSVHPHVRDDDGLFRSTRHGRDLGLFGRSVIHPRQVPVVRAAFAPTAHETEWALAVVEAAGRAGARGAVALDDGTFVDRPVVDRARSILDLAARTAA